jgi:hypothetical protein
MWSCNTRKYMDAKGIKWDPQVCTPGVSAGPLAVLCLSPIKVVALIRQALLAALRHCATVAVMHVCMCVCACACVCVCTH